MGDCGIYIVLRRAAGRRSIVCALASTISIGYKHSSRKSPIVPFSRTAMGWTAWTMMSISLLIYSYLKSKHV